MAWGFRLERDLDGDVGPLSDKRLGRVVISDLARWDMPHATLISGSNYQYLRVIPEFDVTKGVIFRQMLTPVAYTNYWRSYDRVSMGNPARRQFEGSTADYWDESTKTLRMGLQGPPNVLAYQIVGMMFA